MPGRRLASISLMAAGTVLAGLLSAGTAQAATPVGVERPVALAGATAPLVAPTDRRDRDDYWRSFRKGYQIGVRDGLRAARASCSWKRDGYRNQRSRDRGFAAGYGRGFDNGFDRGISWFCRHRR